MAQIIIDRPEEIGYFAAGEVANEIEQASIEGCEFVLVCPGRRTPRVIFEALAQEVNKRNISLSHVHIAMMDEYVVENDGKFFNIDSVAHFSCARFAELEIGQPLNTLAGPGRELKSIRVPDAQSPEEYENWLQEVGIDSIASLSKSVIMVFHGLHKKESVTELLKRSEYDPVWPASIFFECVNRKLVVEVDAS